MKRLKLSFTRMVIFLLLAFPVVSTAQISIGSTDPPASSAVLDLKPQNNNLGMLLPRVSLKSIFDNQTIQNPATGLWVFNTADSDPTIVNESDRVKKNMFYFWNEGRWHELVGNESIISEVENILSQMGIGRPAIFILDGKTRVYANAFSDMLGLRDPLMNVPINTAVDLPLKQIVNSTEGKVKFERAANSNTSKITIEPGIYEFIFVYEFVPTDASEDDYEPPPCKFSPYFMDFPAGENDVNGNATLIRMNSNCVHDGEVWSNHGNTIDCIAVIKEKTEWTVRFGLGNAQADRVSGSPYTCVRTSGGQTVGVQGFIMTNVSTFLYIVKIGG